MVRCLFFSCSPVTHGSVAESPPIDADYCPREPLCVFLRKSVPKKAFPSGNAPPAFAKCIAEIRKPQYDHTRVNLAKTLGVVVAGVIAVWMAYAWLH